MARKKGRKNGEIKLKRMTHHLPPEFSVIFHTLGTKEDICSWSNRLNKSLASFVANSRVLFLYVWRVSQVFSCVFPFFLPANCFLIQGEEKTTDPFFHFRSENFSLFFFLFALGPLVVWHLICCAPVEAKEFQRMKANLLHYSLRWNEMNVLW